MHRFRGRSVALLFDADDAGCKLSREVRRDLWAVSSSLTVLDLAELEPGAKDLTDAVLARRARGEA
jgi:hypothetical protein